MATQAAVTRRSAIWWPPSLNSTQLFASCFTPCRFGARTPLYAQAADWLSSTARIGQRIGVQETIRDTAGRQVRLGRDDSIVSAAPALIHNGRISIAAAAEGVLAPADLSFGYAWANARQLAQLATRPR